MDSNPYLTPAAPPLPPALPLSDDSAEAIRRKHINHEASVRSIGSLHLLGAIFLIPSGLFMAFQPTEEAGIWMGLALLAIGILQVTLGLGLRKLQPWSRIGGAVLAAIGLLGFPIGTLVNAFVLYLLLSKKGAMVFSPDYRRIITETPHVKYKTSIVVWIVLGIFVLVILGLVALAMVVGARP
jgi:hypothetical protein